MAGFASPYRIAKALEQLAEEAHSKRAARVTSVQRLAWWIGQIAHWKSPLARALGDLLLRVTPASAADRQARKLWKPGIELAAEIGAFASSV